MINLHNKNSSSYVPWSAIDVKTDAKMTFKQKNTIRNSDFHYSFKTD